LEEDAERAIESKSEEMQDSELEKEESKKKGRLRTREPYRKAHADW